MINPVLTQLSDTLKQKQERESGWRKAERLMAYRHRQSLIKRGYIIPSHSMPPQLMVRNPNVPGGWSPKVG